MAENADRPFDVEAAAAEFLNSGGAGPPPDLVSETPSGNGQEHADGQETAEPVEPPDDLTTEELRAMAQRRGEAYERAKGGRDKALEQVQELERKVRDLEQYQQDWSPLTNVIAPHGRTPQEAVNNFVAMTMQQPQHQGYDEYGQPDQQVRPMPTMLPSQQIWGNQPSNPPPSSEEPPAWAKQLMARFDNLEADRTNAKVDSAIHRELQRHNVPVTPELTDLVRNVMLGGQITSVGRAMQMIQKTFGGLPGGQQAAAEAASLNPLQGATSTPPGTPMQPGRPLTRANNRQELEANQRRAEDFVRRVLEQNDPSDLGGGWSG